MIFALSWFFSPKSGTKIEKTTEQSTVNFISGDVVMPTEDKDIPDNYLPVSGKENIYKVMSGEDIVEYKEKLADGSFVAYDIEIPDNYKKSTGSDIIYKVLTVDNQIYQYRKFNGKEWDVVDKDGNVILPIPDNYKRVNAQEDVYAVVSDEKTEYKKIIRFDDGTFAWQTIENVSVPNQ